MDFSQHVIEWLWRYGHFRNPGKEFEATQEVSEDDLVGLAKDGLSNMLVQLAVRSYQLLDANVEDQCQFIHQRALTADGEIGPATMATMNMPRCDVPDYAAEATGSGSWPHPGCDPERRDVHSTRVNLNTSRCPSKVRAYLDEAVRMVEEAQAEIGLSMRHAYDGSLGEAEHDVAWENISGSTIGYAYFNEPNTCRQTVKARLDVGYQPDVLMFATLMLHEYGGHSCNLGHTNGGIMNPSLRRPDGELSWAGDPSYPTLRRFFGGEPIDPPTEPSPTPPIDPPTEPEPDPDIPRWLERLLRLLGGRAVGDTADKTAQILNINGDVHLYLEHEKEQK